MADPGRAVKLDAAAAARDRAGMTDPILPPDACTTMAEVRCGVDALDRDLVAMLATRFGYMRAAARIKPERAMVRDEARKAAVIAQAVAHAEATGAPGDVVADLWERLVEASIGYELARFDARARDQP